MAVGINSSTFTLRSREVNSFPARAGRPSGEWVAAGSRGKGGASVRPHPSLAASCPRQSLRVPVQHSASGSWSVFWLSEPSEGTPGSQVRLGAQGSTPGMGRTLSSREHPQDTSTHTSTPQLTGFPPRIPPSLPARRCVPLTNSIPDSEYRSVAGSLWDQMNCMQSL